MTLNKPEEVGSPRAGEQQKSYALAPSHIVCESRIVKRDILTLKLIKASKMERTMSKQHLKI